MIAAYFAWTLLRALALFALFRIVESEWRRLAAEHAATRSLVGWLRTGSGALAIALARRRRRR